MDQSPLFLDGPTDPLPSNQKQQLRHGQGVQMRLVIDSEKCEGHNRCYALAPELVDVDDYGEASVIGDGVVPAELEDKARLCVDNCPEFAITIED